MLAHVGSLRENKPIHLITSLAPLIETSLHELDRLMRLSAALSAIAAQSIMRLVVAPASLSSVCDLYNCTQPPDYAGGCLSSIDRSVAELRAHVGFSHASYARALALLPHAIYDVVVETPAMGISVQHNNFSFAFLQPSDSRKSVRKASVNRLNFFEPAIKSIRWRRTSNL